VEKRATTTFSTRAVGFITAGDTQQRHGRQIPEPLPVQQRRTASTPQQMRGEP
jgi:hypothetical protein